MEEQPTGALITKLFYTRKQSKLACLIATVSRTHPSLIFAGKGRILPSEYSTLWGSTREDSGLARKY